MTLQWKPFRPLRIVRTFWDGMRIAVLHERNVATRLCLSILVLAISLWLNQWFDIVLVTIITSHMLVAELFNTAIEEICDYMQPEYDKRIGTIKDISAAASGLAILMWWFVMIYEVIHILMVIS